MLHQVLPEILEKLDIKFSVDESALRLDDERTETATPAEDQPPTLSVVPPAPLEKGD